MDRETLAQRLIAVSNSEFTAVSSWLEQFDQTHRVAMLIELCREMDCLSVRRAFSKTTDQSMPYPTLDIIFRGWNSALGLLMPSCRGLRGIPLKESTPESLHLVSTLLHQLGRAALLKQAAHMLHHGILEGGVRDETLVLRAQHHFPGDHFLDHLESSKLKGLQKDLDKRSGTHGPFDDLLLSDLESRIAPLVFPWQTTQGTMIGYNAAPEVDDHFLALVAETIVEWRNDAGLYPKAHLGTVPITDVLEIITLLASFHLKHVHFVHVGMKSIKSANYPMSLTIWKPEKDICSSLADFTGMTEERVAAVLNLIVARPEQSSYFQDQPTTMMPMLIEVADGYLLEPVSSLFRNPLHGIRMRSESDGKTLEGLRQPREAWMRDELYALFQGNRYERVDGSIKLRRRGETVTDLDASIFDVTTGELAIFQLKWQDFSSGEIRIQRSKAKNFVEQVDKWAGAVRDWIASEGMDTLRTCLRLKTTLPIPIQRISLFALGRSVARFQSYGYVLNQKDVAVCTWPQFIRCRFEVGPVQNVIVDLHARIQHESLSQAAAKPIPHEILASGQKILFENLWVDLDDGSSEDTVHDSEEV